LAPVAAVALGFFAAGGFFATDAFATGFFAGALFVARDLVTLAARVLTAGFAARADFFAGRVDFLVFMRAST